MPTRRSRPHHRLLGAACAALLAATGSLVAASSSHAATVDTWLDYSENLGALSPSIFGVTHYPSLTPASIDPDIGDHSSAWPLMRNQMGAQFLRADARLQELLPLTVKRPGTNWSGARDQFLVTGPDGVARPFTLDGYKADMAYFAQNGTYLNGLSNPANWNSGRLMRWLTKAKEQGLQTMVMSFQVPEWLGTAGATSAPKDWPVFRDIMSKIYLMVRPLADNYELLNEPHGYINSSGSPARPNGALYNGNTNLIAADYFYESINAMYAAEQARTGNPAARPAMKMGGGADDQWDAQYGVLGTLLKGEFAAASARVDFISIHKYAARPANSDNSNTGTANVRNLKSWLRSTTGRELPLYLNEWNLTPSNSSTPPEVGGAAGVGFHGQTLIDMARDQLAGGGYYTFYPSDVPMDDYEASSSWIERGHGGYTWNNGSPTLRPFASAWNLASLQLQLGKGSGTLNAATYSRTDVSVLAASDSTKVPVFLVNNNTTSAKTTTLSLNGLPYPNGTSVSAQVWTASGTGAGTPTSQTITATVSGGAIQLANLALPAQSLVGGRVTSASAPAPRAQTVYEFEGGSTTLTGGVKVAEGKASNNRYIGYVGNGASNTATVPVTVGAAGTYTLRASYFSGETRPLTVTCGSSSPQTLSVPSSGGWTTSAVATVTCTLPAGVTNVKFSSTGGYAPDLDKLEVTGP